MHDGGAGTGSSWRAPLRRTPWTRSSTPRATAHSSTPPKRNYAKGGCTSGIDGCMFHTLDDKEADMLMSRAPVSTALIAVALAGSVWAQDPAVRNAANTLELTTAEMQKILSTGSATVLDARPAREYAISHIPGALNVAPKPGVPMSLYVSDVAEIGRL